MTNESFKRKLTAILSADVEGYSRLMGEDEDATIRTLTTYRELMSTIIQKHRGRVVDSPGDNMLAEFGSVVEAVRGAVEIQEELRVRNAELPDNRRMEFRIGINLGDVVEEGERIYGDGVNITARVEGLAEGGGICISGTVYDSIKNKLSLGYESLGEHTVKNIKDPVRVYRMRVGPDAATLGVSKKKKLAVKRWQWAALVAIVVLILGTVAVWNFYFRLPSIEPASVEKMAYPLPDKPSIAVLPFDNLSGDTEQDYLADGISDNIRTALSYIPEMFVIARNSSFTYKGKPVKIQQVSEELGVRYVLEGSVLKSGEKIRITAQLIDALTGGHMWSGRYDRDLKDLFNLLDEITQAITVALQMKLTHGEQARMWYRSTRNLEAWGYAVKGLGIFYYYTKGAMAKSRGLFEQALEIDPEYAHALTMLAWTHFIDTRYGYTDSRDKSLKRAIELAKKAVALNDKDPLVHSLWQHIHLLQKQHEKAVEEGRKAISLGPNDGEVHILFGEVLYRSGMFEESVKMCEKSIRLHPHTPIYYFGHTMTAYYWVGRYEESLAMAELLIDKGRKTGVRIYERWGYWGSARAKIRLGRLNEAREDVAKFLEIVPGHNLDLDRRYTLYKPEIIEQEHDDMRKAGFPEHAPLPLPDKPSIAVLAFENMSGDPKQEYFRDGFTEDIITTLAKLPRMFVIARESSFTFKGKSVKIQEVGRDLGVRYVLEGSIQKSGNRVRISAQLIDAKNGHHLWAEKFDRDQQDIFKLRDDVIKEIAIALQVKLTEGEWLAGWGGITNNFDAYIKVKQSLEHFRRFTPDDNILSRQKAKEALNLDTNYSAATQMVAWTLLMDGLFGTSKTPEKSIEQAFELAQKALDKGDDDAGAHYLLGYAYLQKGQFEKAVSELEIARDLFPNSAEINAGLGMVLSDAGRPMEAIPALKNAMRLNPIPPSWYFSNLGGAYRDTEQYEKATLEYKKAIQQQPDNMFAHLSLAVCYVNLNRQEDAHAEAAEVLRINPKFSVERFAKNLRLKDQAAKQRHIDGMRKVGLPE